MTDTGEPLEERPLFTTASKMIPHEEVTRIVEQRQCANKKKGCRFNTHVSWYWCTCCMMLKAIGSEFFILEKRLLDEEGKDFTDSMQYWQLDQYVHKKEYWHKWCNNYPRGAVI